MVARLVNCWALELEALEFESRAGLLVVESESSSSNLNNGAQSGQIAGTTTFSQTK